MHAEAYRYVSSAVQHVSPRLHVVEFGGRNFNGSVRHLFLAAKSYLSIDLYDGYGVDWIGNALDWEPPEFGGDFPDTVVCCEVLEHASEWPELLRHAHSILTERGVLIVTCAAPPREPHSGLDGGQVRPGEYYRNVEPLEFKSVMDDIRWAEYDMSVVDQRGDLYAVAYK